MIFSRHIPILARSHSAGLLFLMLLAASTPSGAADPTGGGTAQNARIEELQRQVDAMRKQMESLIAEIEGMRGNRAPDSPAPRADPKPASVLAGPAGTEIGLGGQYRVNSYWADNDGGLDDQTAARARIRQNVDIKFDERFRTHLQLELGHTSDNVTTTIASSRGNTIAVRHAVLDYRFGPDVGIKAGIVPLADRFGDTLFSSDWDYNPVALAVEVPAGPLEFRAFAANLRETIGTGGGESEADDDTVHYQLDATLPLGERGGLHAGASYLSLSPSVATPFIDGAHYGFGIGGDWRTAAGLRISGFLLGSHTDRELLGTPDDGSGYALKLQIETPAGPGTFGLMATHASGESDGSGFMPIMGLVGTYGYWGYTGLLTVQGPTDTGIDSNAVNLSNNGYGLTTVQAMYALPLTDRLSARIAAGWFGNTDAAGRDETLGADLLLAGSYRFNKVLVLDFGAAFAWLNDSVSPYFLAIPDGTPAAFSFAAGEDRNRHTLFTRFQAEF
ncbi:MAG: hypothetical protein HYY36_00070 [Gammaproteobacteria bacterium]|nr:hypothetical protein [Gammaproteobacteria bacterium]